MLAAIGQVARHQSVVAVVAIRQVRCPLVEWMLPVQYLPERVVYAYHTRSPPVSSRCGWRCLGRIVVA